MSYEDAPSTQMLATHCAVCSRPLRDAISVEVGMGPHCRERHGYDAEVGPLTGEARDRANAIVHQIAAARRSPSVLTAGVAELRALGFAVLAGRIESAGRARATAAQPAVVVLRLSDRGTGWYVQAPFSEEALADWRVLSSHRFARETREWFVPLTARAALWALLSTHYAGHELRSPGGATTIPAVDARSQVAA